MWLRQSTAVDVSLGPFLDSTDGNTQETGLTITQPDIRLKKNGAAWGQKNAAQTLTHEEAGWYEVALDATDTNTLGCLLVAIHESGALACWREFMVISQASYDAIVNGTGLGLRADVQAWLGTAAATPTVAGVPEVDVTHVGGTAQTAGDIIGDTNDIQTKIGTPANLGGGATLAANLSDIEAQTDDIGVAGAGLTAVPWNPAWDAEVQSEAADALVAYDPPTHAELVAEIDAVQADVATRASQASVNVIDDLLDTEIATIQATLDAKLDVAVSTRATPAQVNTEMLDVLTVDTHAELSTPPGATASILHRIIWSCMQALNKHITTPTSDKLRNNADTGDVATSTLANDPGVSFTRGKYS